MDSTAWALCRLMRMSLVEYFLCGVEDEKRYISECEVNWSSRALCSAWSERYHMAYM